MIKKMYNILNSDEYSLLNKEPTSQIERTVYTGLEKNKHLIPAKTSIQLTPHFFKLQHNHGLLKVHNDKYST